MKRNALRAAIPYTLPILVGFLVLGMSYGFLMRSQGFPFLYPVLMSLFIFAGSMQFVAVELLLSAFHPFYAFLLTLMVNSRHLFYGVAMLEKYRGTGWKKPYLIFAMCDETFSVNCSVQPPDGIDRGWFMLFVSLLDQFYWVLGTAFGALLGYVVYFDTRGIEFVMTALFVVIFLNQWDESRDHRPALLGVGCSLACLFLFRSVNFLIPAMALMVLCFSLEKKKSDKEGQQ